ncbi:MAG: phosphate signaling complex protein PhoU [Methanosarcinales archaeon]|jgi:phosphate transport system protein|nr:phosphate signaling complex protein PhoU [Methanosarcinales archaeon]
MNEEPIETTHDIRSEFHNEINQLEIDVLKMSNCSKSAISNAVKSLVTYDKDLAKDVINECAQKITKMDIEIESKCIELIALQQPMAGDLRIITTCLKIITDIVRICDHAVNIAETVCLKDENTIVKPIIDIPHMSDIVIEMIDDSLRAFKTRDADLAKELSKKDDFIDALYDQVRRELITYMIEDPNLIKESSCLTFVASDLERAADHACNIASRVVYMVTGERIRIK